MESWLVKLRGAGYTVVEPQNDRINKKQCDTADDPLIKLSICIHKNRRKDLNINEISSICETYGAIISSHNTRKHLFMNLKQIT